MAEKNQTETPISEINAAETKQTIEMMNRANSVQPENQTEAPNSEINTSETEQTTKNQETKENDTRAQRRGKYREKRHSVGFAMERKYTQISTYVVATVLIIFLLIQVMYHMPRILRGIGIGLRTISIIFRPLILGFVIAYLIFPVTRFLQKKIEKIPLYKNRGKSGLGISILITYIGFVTLLVILSSVVISSVSHELQLVTLDSLTNFVEGIGRSLNSLYYSIQAGLHELNLSSSDVENVAQELGNWVSGIVRTASNIVLSSVQNITGILTTVIFAIVLSIYFLLDAENLQVYWDRVLKAVGGKRVYRYVHIALGDADLAFSGYIRGQLLDAIFMFAIVSVVLSLLRVRFAVIIGILTGIGNLIPYVGPVFAYSGVVFSCFLEGNYQKMIVGLIAAFIVQTIDGNIVNPKLLSRSIHVHPMLVILALIAGNSMGGILGMLTAVPVAALFKMWFDRLINYLMKKRERAEESSAES